MRLQASNGWAMEYGFLGTAGVDLGGFGGHGSSTLTKFYVGHYLKPLVSFFSGSSDDGVIIGRFDTSTAAPEMLTVEGNISASGDLFVNNITASAGNFSSHITASGNISSSGTLDVTGNVNFDGDLDVDGTTNLDVVDIDGAVDMSTTLTVGGVVDITDTTDSSDFSGDTGALRTEGGASIAQKLFVGTDLAVDGTSNLDNTDIDGTLVVDGTNISLDSTSTLNIDNSNTSNGITIGTATGNVPISIGNASSVTTINDELVVVDKIGINETNPQEKLHVIGNIRIEASSNGTNFIDFTEVDDPRARIEFNSSDGINDLSIQTADVAGTLQDRLTVSGSGQVGIGNITPSKALTVTGDISASGTLFGNDISLPADSISGDLINNGTIDSITITALAGNLSLSDNNITAVGDIALDTISSTAGTSIGVTLGTDSGDDFNVGSGKLVVEGDTGRVGIGTASPTVELDVIGSVKSSGNISSPSFLPGLGIGAYGFQITSGSGGNTTFTIDDLNVRKTLNVFEFLIHQIRATNGSLFISNTGKITSASLSTVANHYSMSFETGSGLGHSFKVGDLVRAQRFTPSTNGSGSQVFKSDLHIIAVNNTGSAVGVLTASSDEQHPTSQSAPQVGYEYVRVGNIVNSSRQGSIYLTSDDENAPFIDVVDGITAHSQFNTNGKTKVRLGKLDAITTNNPDFGTLSGFGLYASGSAFLEGGINATEGKIGSFTINSGSISSSNGNLRLLGTGDITGSKVLFDGGKVGGFIIGPNIISSSDGRLQLKSNGQITASAVSMSGTITATSGEIAGFSIVGDTITKGNLTLDSANEQIKLGGTADATSNTGIFLDSDGTFNFATDGNNFIRKNGTDLQIKSKNTLLTGSNVEIHSPSVFFGEKEKAFISGANSNIEISSSNFHLQNNGNLIASSVDLSGKITATSGKFSADVVAASLQATSGSIGGFKLNSNTISTGSLFKLNSNVGTLQIGSVTDFVKDGSDKGLFVSGTGDFFIGKEDGDFIHFDASAGTIAVSSSDINVEVGDLHITASDIDMTTDTFNLNANSGDLLLDSANHQVSLANGNIVLDGTSTGFFQIGNVGDITTTDGTTKGILAQGDGDLMIKAGVEKYIQFNGGELDIKTTKATISGSDVSILTPSFFLGSATNNISSSNDDLSITTKNLTASGSSVNLITRNFLFGTPTNNISSSNDELSITTKNLTASGSSISLGAPNFLLGNKGSKFISGSSAGLEISSSNFHLTTTGDVTMSGRLFAKSGEFSGSLSASTGTIGGFTIADKLSATNIELDPSGEHILVGNGSNIVKMDATDGLFAGATTRDDNTPFQVSAAGRMTASTALITGSSNIRSTGTGSFGRLDGSAQHTTLGSGSIELNTFTSATTMYEAINTIDNILSKLAPAKPVDLSTLSLGFDGNTTFTMYGRNGRNTGSVITSTSPTIKPGGSSNTAFFDGDNGTLTLLRGIDSTFTTIATKSLSTATDVSGSSTSLLQITADEDTYSGTVGSEGFWKQLKVTINEKGRNAGSKKYTNRLTHTTTGTAVDLTYYVEDADGNPTQINNTNITHSIGFNGQHYQSGIPYLGFNNVISSSYRVTIDNDANFLNSARRIGSTRFSDANDGDETFFILDDLATWLPNNTFNTTGSIRIADARFHTGEQDVVYEEYTSFGTSTVDNAQKQTKNFNIDSKQENETEPFTSTERSGSGQNQYPDFARGAAESIATFGKSFDSELALNSSGYFELQFSNEFFHWPAATDYRTYIPVGPDYSTMNGDSSYENLRWATFNIGTITNAANVTLELFGCTGFDNAVIQTSHGFELNLIVMVGSVPSTSWISCNNAHAGGIVGTSNGQGGVILGSSDTGTSGNLTRQITFGGTTYSGTVYVRVGWKSTGGTNPTDTSIRKLKYIYKT